MGAALRIGILFGLVGAAFLAYFLVLAGSIPAAISPVITVLGAPGAIIVYILEKLGVSISETSANVLKPLVWFLIWVVVMLFVDKN